MKYVLFLLFPPLSISAQVGSVQFIDSSTHSIGISIIEGTDITNNDYLDLITSFTGSNGKLAYYMPGAYFLKITRGKEVHLRNIIVQ